MTPVAIFFMILAMLIIWGGLVVAVRFLVKNPVPPDDEPAPGTAPGGTTPGGPGPRA